MSPEEKAVAVKRNKYLRYIGRPVTLGPEFSAEARDHLQALISRGMSYAAMQDQSGIPSTTLCYNAAEVRSRIHRSVYESIMRLRYDPVFDGYGGLVPSLPTARRLQALWADGFDRRFFLESLGGIEEKQVGRLLHADNPRVYAKTEQAVAALYRKFECVDPGDAGVSPYGQTRARLSASKYGYAPRNCWDLDTIEDPNAFPEWTGRCGSEAGARLHTKYAIPRCTACQAAVRVRREKIKEEKS